MNQKQTGKKYAKISSKKPSVKKSTEKNSETPHHQNLTPHKKKTGLTIGIVGSEEAKFTPSGKREAMDLLHKVIGDENVSHVVSGGCHLGGIDSWAMEVAGSFFLKSRTEFKPKKLSWEGGYKTRNIQIAEASDVVHCITVKRLPEGFQGMRFELCYHCKTASHVKSGGCWTMHYAKKLGKRVVLHVIKNEE